MNTTGASFHNVRLVVSNTVMSAPAYGKMEHNPRRPRSTALSISVSKRSDLRSIRPIIQSLSELTARSSGH